MASIHLVLGPVGAGKSTFAAELSQERCASWFNLDDWMATLFGDDDRPETARMEWYVERTERCLRQIWKHTQALLELKVDVVLEVGLIRRGPRAVFYEQIDATDHELTVYVLDAPFDVRWQRVQRRNEQMGATFSMVVSREVFELASNLWEPPDEAECRDRTIHFTGSTESTPPMGC
jgi:predicted kinase